MTNYRRLYIPGSQYFFTVVTHNRKPFLTSEPAIQCLKQSIKTVRLKWKFEVEGFVLLPDHLHTIWRLPEEDDNFSERWKLIKTYFTRCYLKQGGTQENSYPSRNKKQERTFWQRRFWEHQIRNEDDFNAHMDYIHYNPVKHGYVNNPKDWNWSTFHKCVERGWYDLEWGSLGGNILFPTNVGE